MTEQGILRPVETVYVIQYKEPIGKIMICADRADIKDEHLILYKRDSIVYFAPIERVDSFHATKF